VQVSSASYAVPEVHASSALQLQEKIPRRTEKYARKGDAKLPELLHAQLQQMLRSAGKRIQDCNHKKRWNQIGLPAGKPI